MENAVPIRPRARRLTLLGASLAATWVLHGLAMLAMAALLMPVMPGSGLAGVERMRWIGAHPWLFRLGWLPWQLTAASDLLLAAALVRTSWIPRLPAWLGLAFTVGALVPDQGGQALWITRGVALAAAGDLPAYLAFEGWVFRVTSVWGALLYTLGGFCWTACFVRAGAWSRWLTAVSVPLWSVFAFVSLGPLLPAGLRPPQAVVSAGNGLGFVLLQVWVALLLEETLRREGVAGPATNGWRAALLQSRTLTALRQALALGLVACCLMQGGTAVAEEHADLVILGAHVYTVDDARPQAQAVAVRGERLVLVGDDVQARALIGPRTRVIEARGRLLLPGFQDGHTHFLMGGEQVGQLDLRDATTPEEFGRRLADYARTRPAGEWITGGNWDHDKLPGGRLPTAELLDRYVADRPVFVSRFDGHMGVANSAALRAARIDASTPDPPGGLIVRKPGRREPEGVLKDAAMAAVERAIPEASLEQLKEAARKAFAEARRFGLTTVHDMLQGEPHRLAYEALRAEGGMTARVYGRWPIRDWKTLADRVRSQGPGDDLFTLRSLKGFADGSIGSSTAYMYRPYADDPANRGLPGEDLGAIPEWAVAADAAGLQLSIHAIGDRAIGEVLDLFERLERTNGPRDRRPRVEHDQHTHARDFARHPRLGAIASVQPYHAIDDGRFLEARLGRERCLTSYAFRSLLDADAHVAFGSDWPVAPLDPLTGIDAAVNRQTLDGKHPAGWFPEQRVTVAEAIRAYTLGNAYAAFMEAKTGSVTVGKYADLVLLDRDLLRIPPGEIQGTRADLTVLGGRIVYERR